MTLLRIKIYELKLIGRKGEIARGREEKGETERKYMNKCLRMRRTDCLSLHHHKLLVWFQVNHINSSE